MIWLVGALLLLWIALGPWVLVAAAAALFVPRARWWVQDRIHVSRRALSYAAAGAVVLTGLVVVVPDGWLPIPPAPGLLATPSYVGRPAMATPIAAAELPQHPHLARNGAGSRHSDAAASGAYPVGRAAGAAARGGDGVVRPAGLRDAGRRLTGPARGAVQ